MTYTDLLARIASYLHRTDLTDDIPGFVELAESRIYTSLRSLENEAELVVAMTSKSTPLPGDYAEMSHLEVAQARGPKTLQRVPPATFARFERAARTGGAAWFTVQAGSFSVTPFAGDADDPLEATMQYWARLAPLVDTGANDVLTRWPQLFLYGALVEAYLFIAEPTARDRTLATFTDELTFINEAAQAAKWGSAPAAQAG